MNNNDVFRRLRFIFDLGDDKMIKYFKHAGSEVTRAAVSNWLKKDEDPDWEQLRDKDLAYFLNGLIIAKRGKREGPLPRVESKLNNNIVFRKIKIALNYRDTDILDCFDLADLEISKHEISAIFRKPDQKQYRACKDQFLRNFLMGLQLKIRPRDKKDDESEA